MAKELVRGNRLRCIAFLQQADEGEYVITKATKRRSLTANAYYWAMASKLAAALHMSLHEVHVNMLRDYGVHEYFEVRADIPLNDYFAYYDVMSWHAGTCTVRVMKRSSHMDSQEFSRLIGGMREECELQGIQVMTPAELAALPYEGGTDG